MTDALSEYVRAVQDGGHSDKEMLILIANAAALLLTEQDNLLRKMTGIAGALPPAWVTRYIAQGMPDLHDQPKEQRP